MEAQKIDGNLLSTRSLDLWRQRFRKRIAARVTIIGKEAGICLVKSLMLWLF